MKIKYTRYQTYREAVVIEVELPTDRPGLLRDAEELDAMFAGDPSVNLDAYALRHGKVLSRDLYESDDPLEATAEVILPVELDTESSASRQHFIDTGEYLPKGEALTEDDHHAISVAAGHDGSFYTLADKARVEGKAL